MKFRILDVVNPVIIQIGKERCQRGQLIVDITVDDCMTGRCSWFFLRRLQWLHSYIISHVGFYSLSDYCLLRKLSWFYPFS